MTVVQEASASGYAGDRLRGRGPKRGSSPRKALVDGYKWWIPWMFLLPTIVSVVLFLLVPLVAGVAIAFAEWNVVSGINGIEWVGLANFVELFQDDMFWSSLLRTFFYAGVGTPLTIFVGMLLGIALNYAMPARGVLRAIFYLPSLVNVIAAGTVWLTLLNPQSGMVNQFLRALGIDNPPGWFTSQEWALPGIVLMSVWLGAGYVSILVTASLQDLPAELYESAKIDGAGAFRQFTTITLPGLVPILTFLLITSFIGRSQGFGMIQFMTGGGPGDSTTVLSYYMYEVAFHRYEFGYSAAIGIMSMLGVLVLSMVLFRLQRGRGLYT